MSPADAWPAAAPVLVAADGTPLAANAANAANAAAERRGAQVRAVHVVDARGLPLPPPVGEALALADALMGPGVHDEQVREVQAALGRALGRAVDWPVDVTLGRPAAAIDAAAERAEAGLVVVGLQQHGRLARLVRDETVVGLMRESRRPVLAVAPALGRLPQRVQVAVDFTRASLGAAHAAAQLLAPGGVLTLAYAPPLPLYHIEDGEHMVHELGVDAAFDWFEASLGDALGEALGGGAGGRVERVVVRAREARPPAAQLLAHAEAAGAELLAVGSRRYGRVEPLLLGSTTADVVRDGRVSVLAVPPEWAPPGGAPDLASPVPRAPAVTY